jgi:hypothetical protein
MEQNDINGALLDRRSKPRIKCAYPAIIRGSTKNGKKFEENATVLNLSAGGAYVMVNRQIDNGQELSVKIGFPTGSLELGTSKLATVAIVVRTEDFSEGVLGVGIKFQHYRFL